MIREALAFSNSFKRSYTPSVDLFITRNREIFEGIGKLAIVHELYQAEKKCAHWHELEEREVSQDWFAVVSKWLTGHIRSTADLLNFPEGRVGFITFNYDRSLEHMLYGSLKHSFGEATHEQVVEVLSRIPVVHVYGQYRPLEWQGGDFCGEYKGDIRSLAQMEALSENIRIAYDQTENPHLQNARDLLIDAQKVFFLGFSFAPENVQALGIPGIWDKRPAMVKVRATSYGLTKNEQQECERVLVDRRPKERAKFRVQWGRSDDGLQTHDCARLLRDML